MYIVLNRVRLHCVHILLVINTILSYMHKKVWVPIHDMKSSNKSLMNCYERIYICVIICMNMDNINNYRLKCPCCGTWVRINRIGKDYDLEMAKIEYRGYKKIMWIKDKFTGNKYWIAVLKKVLERLGYKITKTQFEHNVQSEINPLIEMEIIPAVETGQEPEIKIQPVCVREFEIDGIAIEPVINIRRMKKCAH